MPAAGTNAGGSPSGGLGAIYLAGGQCFGFEGTWYLAFVLGGAVGTEEVSWDVSLSGGWSHTIVSATGPVLVVQVWSGWCEGVVTVTATTGSSTIGPQQFTGVNCACF